MEQLWQFGHAPLILSQVALLITSTTVMNRWDSLEDYDGFSPDAAVIIAAFGTIVSIKMSAIRWCIDNRQHTRTRPQKPRGYTGVIVVIVVVISIITVIDIVVAAKTGTGGQKLLPICVAAPIAAFFGVLAVVLDIVYLRRVVARIRVQASLLSPHEESYNLEIAPPSYQEATADDSKATNK